MIKRRKCAEVSTTKNGRTMITLRGSSYGGCIHSHVASLRGLQEADPPPHMQAIFDRGHAAEAWAKKELEKRGVVFLEKECGLDNQQQQQLALFTDMPDGRLIRLAITPDGLAYNKTGEKTSMEFKSFSKDAYREFELHGLNERYAYQVSAEVHAYRRRERCHVGGAVVPIIASNNPDWRLGDDPELRWEFVLGSILSFREPVYSEEQCLERCRRIVGVWDSGDFPVCDSKYPCRYPHSPPPASDVELDAVVARYLVAEAEYRAALAELEPMILGLGEVAGKKIERQQLQTVRLL